MSSEIRAIWLRGHYFKNNNRIKLEASVATLIENAAFDKSQVSERFETIESNVDLVKNGLGAKIDHVAVSKTFLISNAKFLIDEIF